MLVEASFRELVTAGKFGERLRNAAWFMLASHTHKRADINYSTAIESIGHEPKVSLAHS